MSTNGKGSTRRPAAVDRDTLASNWERTFGGGAPSDVVDLHVVVTAYLNQFSPLRVKADTSSWRGAELKP